MEEGWPHVLLGGATLRSLTRLLLRPNLRLDLLDLLPHVQDGPQAHLLTLVLREGYGLVSRARDQQEGRALGSTVFMFCPEFVRLRAVNTTR